MKKIISIPKCNEFWLEKPLHKWKYVWLRGKYKKHVILTSQCHMSIYLDVIPYFPEHIRGPILVLHCSLAISASVFRVISASLCDLQINMVLLLFSLCVTLTNVNITHILVQLLTKNTIVDNYFSFIISVVSKDKTNWQNFIVLQNIF